MKEGHPFERLSDHEYLRNIGAAAISEEDGKLHPDRLCLRMEMNMILYGIFLSIFWIIEKKWVRQFVGLTGYNPVQVSGQVMFRDFYFRVYNKIIKDIKVPFKMIGGERVDDTPVHKAIREALANCLINADYHGVRGVVIRKEEEKIIFANPGYVRTGKKQKRLGGESDPRINRL